MTVNIPSDLNTFLAALQQELEHPIQLMQIKVEDRSNRLEWVIKTVYKNTVQQWSIWLNPNGEYGWGEYKYPHGFGF